MNALFVVFVSGALFALGLGISGMTDADKVIGFLNLAGDWDPSLAFVMVGAIGVHLLSFRLITRRKSPVFAELFRIPQRQEIDLRLCTGAALFGVGWGLCGYCPGPGLVSVVTLAPQAGVFVLSLLLGMFLFRLQSRPERIRSQKTLERADG